MKKVRGFQLAIEVGYFEEEGQFRAQCIHIPCCTGTGNTADEAVTDVLDTVQSYIHHRNALGLSPFVDSLLEDAN